MKIVYLSVFLLSLWAWDSAQAEPWIANRYAQNCASCHTPGRLNRKPSKRRCTLSCQGCHVNPNGGGLRNHYGKWNEERWLRSFYSDMTWNKKSTDVKDKQHFMKKKLSKRKKRTMVKKGAPLVDLPKVIEDDKPYFESSNYKDAPSKAAEMMRMAREDPYRTERQNQVTVGGDLRFFFLQSDRGGPPDALSDGTFFPMMLDVGVRVRPTKENFSFVYEGRALNQNRSSPGSLDKLFGAEGGAITRSAYILADDLWYNSYVQYGWYRPMFGLYDPNHVSMMVDYTQLGYGVAIKALGFGTAPNVPFGMVNIHQASETGLAIEQEDGFSLTLGMRFVSYGAHIQATYWDTANDTATVRKRRMWNVNAGGVLGRFIFNSEITNVRRESNTRIDETNILMANVRYRVWRELYGRVSFTTADAAYDISGSDTQISPGSGQEVAYGIRFFTIAGLETDLWIANKSYSITGGTDINVDTMAFQIHAYY